MRYTSKVEIRNKFRNITDIVSIIEINLRKIQKELETKYRNVEFKEYKFEKYVPWDSYGGVHLVEGKKYYIVFYFEVD